MNNSNILQEAFKQLELIEEEVEFPLDAKGAEEAKDYMSDSEALDALEVIDSEAETEEDLEESHIGDVILECSVCHSQTFMDPEEVNISEENDLANEGTECPYCYCTNGFKVIGQVAPYKEPPTVEIEPKEPEEDIEDVEEEDIVEESFRTRRKNKLTESVVELDIHTLANDERGIIKELRDSGLPQSIEIKVKSVSGPGGGNPEILLLGDLDEIKDYLHNSGYEEGFYTVLEESLENVDIETEHDIIHVNSEEKIDSDEEMLAPLEPEVKDEIEGSDEEEFEEEPEDEFSDEYYEDIDIENFDEDTFNTMGESYLKKVYENVKSFKTSKVREQGNKWIVEGKIGFKSGKNKDTQFVFEALSKSKNGLLTFTGCNKQISRGNKSFILKGAVDANKFFTESLRYNYRQKDSNGKSVRVYGTIKRK